MTKKKGITDYKEIKKWLEKKRPSTRGIYLVAINSYLKFTKLNPKQLIDEIEEDRKKSPREMGKPESRLHQFYDWMINEKDKVRGGWHPIKTGEKGLSQKSASTTIGAIRSFYKANHFPILDKMENAIPKKENRKLNLRADDVKRLVDHAPTLRDKAIILMLFQSGVDVSTLCKLDYGDVARGLKESKCPLPIHVVRKKKNIEYTTFLGRDGIDVLKAYLNKRFEKGGKPELSDPLFVKEKNYNGETRITPNLIQKMLREVSVISGIVNKEEMERSDMNPCRPHALRGAFSSIMKLEGVNNDIVEYWMGHKLPYESAYFIPEEEELQRIYREHEESLSINRSIEQVKKLEQKYNGKMETYDEIINRQANEIEKLKLANDKQLGKAVINILDDPEIQDKLLSKLITLLGDSIPELKKAIKKG